MRVINYSEFSQYLLRQQAALKESKLTQPTAPYLDVDATLVPGCADATPEARQEPQGKRRKKAQARSSTKRSEAPEPPRLDVDGV